MLERDITSKLNISFLNGRVIDVEPITFDSDTGAIWEQDIVFQLDSGTRIYLSDNDLECKKEDIGQKKAIQIVAGCYRGHIEKCNRDNPKIGIYLNTDFSSRVCGTIKQIVEPSEEKFKQFRRYASLDIGIGQILLVLFKDHNEDFSIFRESDCILMDVTLEVINPEINCNQIQ